ncbi:hypothetical protein [Bradyrhizobium neotropicale]|uniref:hypothetical protein n=1 Tax=Bradyrhizobium neotropicale TaxID=1497615 RepID=UPI001AD6568C|nr:hypothetical protein [Bradyrhizobium neotropicale]
MQLHLPLGRWPAMHAGVGVDEDQMLALLGREGSCRLAIRFSCSSVPPKAEGRMHVCHRSNSAKTEGDEAEIRIVGGRTVLERLVMGGGAVPAGSAEFSSKVARRGDETGSGYVNPELYNFCISLRALQMRTDAGDASV